MKKLFPKIPKKGNFGNNVKYSPLPTAALKTSEWPWDAPTGPLTDLNRS